MALQGDNPITDPSDDVLGRARRAKSFALQIVSFDVSQGLVVGVLGPWGSGKTSFVNLTKSELSESGITIVDFNPWMFSGAEQLVESFFVEIAAQLTLKPGMAEIGKDLEDYGEIFSGLGWLPLVGPWIERGRGATKILAKLLQRRKEGVSGRRSKLERALRNLNKPIVVVLDDIDRLSTAEIRDVFKLVRLTASFPNVIYLVAFDRARVEDALAEQGIPGRDYLEKILQVGVDLPVASQPVVDRQIFRAINEAINSIENAGDFDGGAWPDLYVEVIRPLIRNMRDVRRYAVAVHGTVLDLEGHVQLVDVLALEAIRVFLPDVFTRITESVDGLSSTSGMGYGARHEPPHLKAQIDELLAAAHSKSDVVTSMIMRLFPAAQRHIGGSHYGSEWKRDWLAERRVAHGDILRLYLERVAGEGLEAFLSAEEAWGRITDEERFDEYLRGIDPERQEDVIGELENFESRFSQEHVVPGVTALLNLLDDLPERQRGMFELDTPLVVGRLTYRLLRVLPDESDVKRAVDRILPKLRSLSARLDLIDDVGHREGRGHKLVSAQDADLLERAWRDLVRATSTDRLAGERELLRILLLTKRESEAGEPELAIDGSAEMTLAMLESAKSEVRSQSMESRAVRRSARLAWAVLIELYGDENLLMERLEALKATNPRGADDLIALAERYASGWRPSEFGD